MKHRILQPSFLLLLVSFLVGAQTVYTTKTGKKYHKDNCLYLNQSKIETTLSHANEGDRTACSVRKPTTSVTNTKLTNSAPFRKAVSSQCFGTNKAGTRCKCITMNAKWKMLLTLTICKI